MKVLRDLELQLEELLEDVKLAQITAEDVIYARVSGSDPFNRDLVFKYRGELYFLYDVSPPKIKAEGVDWTDDLEYIREVLEERRYDLRQV